MPRGIITVLAAELLMIFETIMVKNAKIDHQNYAVYFNGHHL